MREIQTSQALRELKKRSKSVRHRYWLWEVAIHLTKIRNGYSLSFAPPDEPVLIGPTLHKDLSKSNTQTELCAFLTQWFKGGDQMHAAFEAAIIQLATTAPLGRVIVFHSNGNVTTVN